MTREEAKQTAEILLAYANGKKIECISKVGKDDYWKKENNPAFNFGLTHYRIAPDQEEPEKHYRPYTMEEFTKDMHKHDGFVRNSISKHRYGFLIIDILDECVCIKDGNLIQYNILCEHYVWSDNGQPCGKEVEE